MIRYGREDLGCRHGQPHDFTITFENPYVKWERCKICGKKFRWNKATKGRTDNVKYLKAHVRNFAQRFGPTKRVYNQIYRKEHCTIVL